MNNYDTEILVTRISDLERDVKNLTKKLNELIEAHDKLSEKYETYLLKQDVEIIVKNSKHGGQA